MLSPRELQVYTLLRQGLSVQEIADKLNINVRSARNYITTLHSKLKQGQEPSR